MLLRLWHKVIAGVADIRFYNLGLILWGDSHYRIKGADQREILSILRKGDILLRRYNNYLGSVAIPGYWSHAALYAGEDKVIHMLGKGITEEDILTFMRCDDVAILRCYNTERTWQAVNRAQIQLKKAIEYDYDFKTDQPDKFYCTELVDYVFKGFNYTKGIKKWILPDNLLDAEELTLCWSKATGRCFEKGREESGENKNEGSS